MTALKSFAGSLALALVIPLLGVMSFAAEPAVQVRTNSSILDVEIKHSSALSGVLNEICEKMALECSGTDKAAEISVAPVVIRGTWDHVLLKLMEGAGLNYVASNPGAGYKGKLLIQGPALAIPKQGGLNQGISATMTYVQSPDDNHSNENLSSVNPGSRADTNSTPMSAVPATVQPSSPGAGSSGINAVAGMQGSPFTSEIPPNPDSPRELQAGFLPFPDEHGRPIPASNEPPQFLPFPDSKGNPIPVDPNAPTGSPFPVEAIRQAQGRGH